MNVLLDEWSGLFSELENRVSSAGRQKLLGAMAEAVKESCLTNFGGEMAGGDMRPWHDEQLLSEDYIRTIGRDFATLYRTEDERQRCSGTKWSGGTGPHLGDPESFQIEVGDDFASVTNIVEYASNQQLGIGVPARPFFPVDESGQLMPFMEARLFQLADAHFQV